MKRDNAVNGERIPKEEIDPHWFRVLRIIRLCLRIGLVCCLAVMFAITFMVLGQEYLFAQWAAAGIPDTRVRPHTPYYIAMFQLSGASLILLSLLLLFRIRWDDWTHKKG